MNIHTFPILPKVTGQTHVFAFCYIIVYVWIRTDFITFFISLYMYSSSFWWVDCMSRPRNTDTSCFDSKHNQRLSVSASSLSWLTQPLNSFSFVLIKGKLWKSRLELISLYQISKKKRGHIDPVSFVPAYLKQNK